MKKLDASSSGFLADFDALCRRPGFPPEALTSAAAIIADVERDGDAAVCRYAEQFDHVKLAPDMFRVTEKEIHAAIALISPEERRAIDTALAQIRDFARRTMPLDRTFSPRDGVTLGERFLPMNRVGVYIPGGTAPLVSTVIHTAGIASAVGVREIAAATPCGRNGAVHPPVLYAMLAAGVTEIYRLGGVYGVAALAVGTATVKPVEKLVGPGNAFVTAAKKLLYGRVAIDMVAGPSEVMVIADGDADPEFVAADLLSQAEHGSGLEQAVLVTDSDEMLKKVEAEFHRQKASLPKLAAVERVERDGLFFIKVKDMRQAGLIATDYAPEHLIIQTAYPEAVAADCRACGAIFLGAWTPESMGDFCAGPSHVLPTASSAHGFSGIESATFMRRTSMACYSRNALKREAGIVEMFGNMESLTAHARAATVRKNK